MLGQRMKIAASLTIIIVMVLMINVLNKRHFNELQESLSSVYKDRLMVEVYIYKITAYLNEKNNFLFEEDKRDLSQLLVKNKSINDSIAVLVKDFGLTHLTVDESDIFDQLKSNLEQLYILEDSIFQNPGHSVTSNSFALKTREKLDELSNNLHLLSDIQKNEGQKLIEESNRIILNSKFALQLELVILIVIGLIVQALVFATKSTRPKINQNPGLN